MPREFKTYLSGGASNSDPDASLGGVQSAQEYGVQTLAWDTTPMTGVTLVSGSGNKTTSAGTLSYDSAAQTMTWSPPGYTSGTQNAVDVSSDGTYHLFGTDATDQTAIGAVEVTVVSGSLPVSNDSKDINSTNSSNTLFDDIVASESQNGMSDYRCIYVQNESAGALTCNVWIQKQPSPDSVKIALDLNGAGNTAATIANETTAPSAVVFTTPSEAAPLAVALAAGQSIGLWIERSIPALNQTSNGTDIFLLGIKSA